MVQPFALYLVERGVISSRQLLDAYTQMMSETPAVWEVLVQEKLFDESQLLEILTAQEMGGTDTISVLRQMGLWQASLETKVLAAMNARRVPLTVQLVQSGAIKLADLTPVLDEYVVMVEEHRKQRETLAS